jgi:UDP-N-acetylmuramoylalanine--D-glutamate ligase
MLNTDYFKNKKIAIIGFARSGLACANLLDALGAEVSVTDNQDSELIQQNIAKLKSKKIKVELGRHTPNFIKGRNLAIVSPGVPKDARPVVWADKFNVPIISEIELAWILCPAKIIAVTGSNGKTTVTTLVGKILEAKGERVFVCGNIGNPFAGEVDQMTEKDYVSLEVSSFQLENIDKFKPKISVMLNFSRNHLDRYIDIEEYLKAKKRIFKNQDKSDYLVVNSEDAILKELAKETCAQVVYFSRMPGLSLNQSAVLTVAELLGVERELCLDVFRDFKGLEHRQEYVAEIDEVIFINDSKATTVESSIYALESIDRPILLIAGGKDKGLDYSVILDSGLKKIKEVILIGEAKEKIKESFKGKLPLSEANSLKEAVAIAFKKSRAGDCVLLSPMCSSFDMFRDYEERGKIFKKIVLDLARSKT